MAGPTLSRFLGLFRLRDATNAARMAAVSAAGEVSVAASQLGEVQASPTANTVLDRLKTIATALAGSLKTVSGQEIPVAGGGQITALSSAVGLSNLGTIPPTATRVLLQAEDQDIRWSDVADPTTTTGMKLEARQTIEYAGDLSAIKFIAVVSGAKLNVLYYR